MQLLEKEFISDVPRQTKGKTIERELAVWELRSRGMKHQGIADQLGVTRQAVTKILTRVSARANAQMIESIIQEKQEQIARLNHVIAEAMTAWEKSKGKFRKVRQKIRAGQTEDKAEVITTIEERDGDPAFLQTAIQAMADLRKIMGLDAPLKNLNIDMSKLTDEQLDRIRNGEDPLNVLLASPTDGGGGTGTAAQS